MHTIIFRDRPAVKEKQVLKEENINSSIKNLIIRVKLYYIYNNMSLYK